MPTDRNDLSRRLAECKDADTSRGLNFNRLFDLVRENLGEDAARACDPAGKGTRVDFFSYPVADYLRIAWDAADRLEPKLGSVDAVFAELGRLTVTGFLSSVLGRTIYAMAGRDPRRFVAAGPSGYRSAVSYGERTVEWRGEKAARMVFKRDFMPPAFHRAVILAALEASEAKNGKVEACATGLLDSEYAITWE
jgi:uncharacterized protein (TIGR02265 family)